MSASEIPPDSAPASPVPLIVIILKVLMMPVTVPSRPISGAEAAHTTAMNGKKLFSLSRASRVFSYITSSISCLGSCEVVGTGGQHLAGRSLETFADSRLAPM